MTLLKDVAACMSNYLLDTNHVSPLVTPGHPLRKLILSRVSAGDQMGICVPVLTEVLFGIGIAKRAVQNQIEWRQLQRLLPCYIVDKADGQVAAELQISLRRQGWQLETVDSLIAAVALRFELTLLTTDKDFQAVPNLRCENWLKV